MKSHAIVTYTGVHYFLTSQQELILRDKKLDEEIDIEGCLLKVKNIADILTIEKYYETYPQRKPTDVDKYKTLEGLGYDGIVKFADGEALQGMIKGLKRYIASTPENPVCPNGTDKAWYQGTQAPIELLAKMEAKLQTYNQPAVLE